MSSRVAIQQFVSNTEPIGAALGDEWYVANTGLLYKRTAINGTQVGWVNIAVIPSGGSTGQVLTYGTSGTLTWTTSTGGAGTLTNPFSGVFTITNTTVASSTITGALQVAGGVGVGGTIYSTNLVVTDSASAGFNAGALRVSNGGIFAQSMYSQNGVSMGNGTNLTPSTLQLFQNGGLAGDLASAHTFGIFYNVSGGNFSSSSTGANNTASFHYIKGMTINQGIFPSTWKNVSTLRIDVPTSVATNTTVTNLLSVHAVGPVLIESPTSSSNIVALQVIGSVKVGDSEVVGNTATFGSNNPVSLYVQGAALSGNVTIASQSTGTNLDAGMTFQTNQFGGWKFQNKFNGSLYTQFEVSGLNGTPSTYPVLRANAVTAWFEGAVYTAAGANNNVILTAPGTGLVIVSNTANSTGTTSGAFIVRGGTGIALDLYVGGVIRQQGWAVSTASSGGGVSSPYSGIFTITNTTSATSTITGALQVAGGVGIAGNIFLSGSTPGDGGTMNGSGSLLYVKQNTTWSGAQPWALYVSGYSYLGGFRINGGDGVRSLLQTNLGTDLGFATQDQSRITFVTSSDRYQFQITNTNNAWNNLGVTGAIQGQSPNIYSTGTDTTISITAIPKGNGSFIVASAATATSTSTGALVVTGGTGISGDLYVGGLIRQQGWAVSTSTGSVNTSTNIANGTTGQIPYQVNPGATSFFGPGTAGQLLVSAGASAPVYTNTASIYVGGATFAATATVATTAVNLAGGAVGSIPFQSSTGTTNYIGISNTSGYVLTVQGSTATWSAPSSISAGTATNSTNVAITDDTTTGTPQFVTFVNVSSGPGGIRTSASKLSYIASTGVLATPNMFITGSGASTSTTSSNALYVAGGTYLNSLYVRNDALFAGNVTFNGTSTYVYSTNTVYTDNIIELHTPPGGVNAQWQLDDGKDVGIRIHYYANSTDTNAALVLDNSTKELHWYSNGAESNIGDFSTATFGAFRTGNIVLTSSTNATTTQTGALQVAGGVGIGRDLVVGGNITVAGTINASITGVITSATTVAITNDVASTTPQYIAFVSATSGYAGIKVDNSAGLTFIPSSNYVGVNVATPTTALDVSGNVRITGATTITNTTVGTSTTTGALIVAGSIGSGPVYSSSLFDNANRVVTQVNPVSGTAIGITAVTNTGTATSFTINNFGVTAAVGTTYLGVSASTGSVTFTNLGVQTLTAGTDTAVSASTGTITVWNTATLQSVTSRGSTTTNAINITNSSISNTTTNGALTVAGGVGIQGNLNVGGTITGVFVGSVTTSSNINITNDTSTAVAQYITFVSTSSGSVSIKTNATSGLTYIPSSSSLGIGVVATSTNFKLDVGGEIRSGSTGQGFYNTTLNSGYWWNNSGLRFDGFYLDTTNNRLSFRKGNTDNVMIIDSNNNVGIGTVSPTSSAGYATLSVAGSNGGQVTYQNGTTLKGFSYNDATNMNHGSQAALIFMAGGATEGGRFDSTRNFMVGTVTAQSKVTVLGGTITVGVASSYALALGNTNANDVTLGSDGSYGYIQSWNSKPLQINNQGNNTLVNVSSGNVGIATTSPLAKLSIGGGSLADGNVLVQISTSAASGQMYYGVNRNGSYGSLFGYDNVNYGGATVRNAVASGTAGDAISFVVNNGNEVVRITSAGNLGLGTTSPTANLHVVGGALITGITTSSNSTNATSTSTGALQVAGGVGIGRDLYVGGNVTVAGTINANITGVSNTATNVGVTNDTSGALIHYVTFVSTTTGYTNIKGNNAAFVFVPSTNALSLGTQNSAGRLTVLGTTITVGTQGTYAATFGNGTTTDVSIGSDGTNGYIQTFNSKVLQLNNQGNNIVTNLNGGNVGIGVAPGTRLQVQTLATGTDGIYVTSAVGGGNVYLRPNNSSGANNGITQAGDAGIIYSSAGGIGTGGFVIAPWFSGTSGMRFDNSGTVQIASTAPASSTQTGALRILGGLGVGGSIYAGNIYSNGTLLTAGGGGGGASVTVSDTPPVSPTAGNLWFDSTIGQMFIYYNDGNSLQWVPASPGVQGPSGATGPQGIQGVAGPAGVNTGTNTAFLITDSTQAVSTTTGALQVRGGVGIGGNFFAAGTINSLLPTNATNTTTGALIIRGGAGIGSDLFAGALYSQSAVYAVGNIFANYSDIRLKDVQGKIEDPITKICSIDTFYYTPNKLAVDLGVTELQRQVGLSAQSVQAVYSEAVAPSPLNKDYLTVQYERLVPLLIEGIKQHQEEIQQLKQQVLDLQNKVK